MPCRPRPEAEEEPQRCDTAQRLRTIERWLQHAEEELLYTPDAQVEASATPLDARQPDDLADAEHRRVGPQPGRGQRLILVVPLQGGGVLR